MAAVQQLAEHYHRSPDQLTEEELRQYSLCEHTDASECAQNPTERRRMSAGTLGDCFRRERSFRQHIGNAEFRHGIQTFAEQSPRRLLRTTLS